jgi:hypothetical protein
VYSCYEELSVDLKNIQLGQPEKPAEYPGMTIEKYYIHAFIVN